MESGEVVIVGSWRDRGALGCIGPLGSCPIGSMYGIFSYTYHRFKHGACKVFFLFDFYSGKASICHCCVFLCRSFLQAFFLQTYDEEKHTLGILGPQNWITLKSLT